MISHTSFAHAKALDQAASRPVPSAPASVASSSVPTKPEEDDRIAPVGTAYTPVALPAPKKLRNPFEAMQQQSQQQAPAPVPKKAGMTWSERQALAKQRAEEEEAASRAAGWKQPSGPSVVNTPGTPAARLGSSVQPSAASNVTAGRAGLNTAAVAGAAAVGGATVGAVGKMMLEKEEEEAEEDWDDSTAAPVSNSFIKGIICFNRPL
jgi:drebrin-like protein